MKNLADFINERFETELNILNEASIEIDSENSSDFDSFLKYIQYFSKNLKIQNGEKQRYEKKGTPITKEIAQDLLSKRLYNNVSVRYATTPEFFLSVCKKYNITVNMSNLGFGKDEVIKWGIPEKKMLAKDIYFDDVDIVWYDKTIGFIYDDGGIEILPEYEKYTEDVLKILKRKYKYDNWYIAEK